MRQVADVSSQPRRLPGTPPKPRMTPREGSSLGRFSYIRNMSRKARAKASQVDPCLILPRACKNLHELSRTPRLAAFSRGGHGRDSLRYVLMAVAPAPAQYVARVLTAPPVDDLGRHLQTEVVLTAVLNERPEIIDQFRGGVIANMRRAGERFVINGPARRDRPGQTRGGRSSAFSKIFMYSRNMRRAGGRRILRPGQAVAANGNVHRVNERLRPGRLSVDAHHLGLLDRLVQVVELHPVALRGEDHRCRPARPA